MVEAAEVQRHIAPEPLGVRSREGIVQTETGANPLDVLLGDLWMVEQGRFTTPGGEARQGKRERHERPEEDDRLEEAAKDEPARSASGKS